MIVFDQTTSNVLDTYKDIFVIKVAMDPVMDRYELTCPHQHNMLQSMIEFVLQLST